MVPNPSFEDQQYCNSNFDNLGSGVLHNWFNPNIATPDYYNACWEPLLQYYYSPPNGQGFIGLCTYTTGLGGTNIREYSSVQLNDTLLPNRWYVVSFYARVMRDRSRFASNNLGVHFSDTLLHSNNGYVFYTSSGSNLNAQVKYFNNEVISDTSSWTWIRGLYQAHGGEKYLTLGNFNTDNQTTQGMEYMDGSGMQTYFLIDLVSVTSLDNTPGGLPADAGADTTIYLGDTAFIGQKISNMPSEWHKLDGTPVATNTAGVYVNPQETTTYVITQTINGLYSSDTVTVFVIDNLGESELTQSMLKLYPVPNYGSFQLQGNMNEGDQLFIMQLDGQVVLEETVSEACEVLALQTTVSSGTYVLVLKNKSGQVLYRNRVVVIR
jgi:hypothetical protein